MTVGIGILGLGPAQFWALTPREYLAATALLQGMPHSASLRHHDLAALMAQFPDSPRP